MTSKAEEMWQKAENHYISLIDNGLDQKPILDYLQFLKTSEKAKNWYSWTSLNYLILSKFDSYPEFMDNRLVSIVYHPQWDFTIEFKHRFNTTEKDLHLGRSEIGNEQLLDDIEAWLA